MGRNTATINYGISSVFRNTVPMYIFGSGILAIMKFLIGLVQTETINGAVQVALNYYISKLTPFPLNEFLTASGFTDVAVSVTLAIVVGAVVASYRYRKRRY